MKHYTEQLWKDAYDAWCDYIGQFVTCPTYAEVFDKLMERGVNIYIAKVNGYDNWHGYVGTEMLNFYTESWHEAANEVIKKAIKQLKAKEL